MGAMETNEEEEDFVISLRSLREKEREESYGIGLPRQRKETRSGRFSISGRSVPQI